MNDSAHRVPAPPGSGTPHAFGPNLTLHGSAYALSLLARLGHPDVHQPEVGRLATRCFELLFREVVDAELGTQHARVPTRMTAVHPEHAYEGAVVDRGQKVVVVDVARAGILGSQVFYDRFNELLEPAGVRQDHLFVSRSTDASGAVTGAAVTG